MKKLLFCFWLMVSAAPLFADPPTPAQVLDKAKKMMNGDYKTVGYDLYGSGIHEADLTYTYTPPPPATTTPPANPPAPITEVLAHHDQGGNTNCKGFTLSLAYKLLEKDDPAMPAPADAPLMFDRKSPEEMGAFYAAWYTDSLPDATPQTKGLVGALTAASLGTEVVDANLLTPGDLVYFYVSKSTDDVEQRWHTGVVSEVHREQTTNKVLGFAFIGAHEPPRTNESHPPRDLVRLADVFFVDTERSTDPADASKKIYKADSASADRLLQNIQSGDFFAAQISWNNAAPAPAAGQGTTPPH